MDDFDRGGPVAFISPCVVSGTRYSAVITVRNPEAAIAVVIDLSDSVQHRVLNAAIGALSKLLKHAPSAWPVWFFQMSSQRELIVTEEAVTVGKLRDGWDGFSTWTDNRQFVDAAKMRGSFLGPVIQGIDGRRIDETFNVFTFVLTDCEVFDADPITVPRGVNVVGIQLTDDFTKRSSWRRVLPQCEVFSFDDNRLDKMLRDIVTATRASCRITIASRSGTKLEAASFDSKNGSISPLPDSSLPADLSLSPVYLLIGGETDAFDGLRLVCDSGRGQAECIELIPCEGRLAEDLQKALSKAAARPEDDLPIVFELSFGDPSFNEAWHSFRKAAALITSGATWLDSGGALSIFNDGTCYDKTTNALGQLRWDALLCVSNANPEDQMTEKTRILVFGLTAEKEPALYWHADSPVTFQPSGFLKVTYDHSENEWKLESETRCRKTRTKGLDLNGIRLKTGEVATILFSGPIR